MPRPTVGVGSTSREGLNQRKMGGIESTVEAEGLSAVPFSGTQGADPSAD